MSFSCLTHIQKNLWPIVLNSGRGPFRLGNYYGCLNTEGMDYFMISAGNEGTSVWSGVCLPGNCSTDSIKTIMNMLLQKYKVPLLVEQVSNGFDHQQIPYDWVFFLTIILIMVLAILVLIATFSKSIENQSVMSAFSLHNSLKIFKYKDNPLNTLNGVRSLCMLWVIFGHQYSMGLGQSENLFTLQNQAGKLYFLIIQAGFFSVDTFFFLGGFLVAYALLKDQNASLLKYPLGIVNRWLRLAPAYLMTILFFYSVLKHLGSGPLWLSITQGTEACSSIWRPLLFVDNLVENGDNMCLGWGWYLQNDMQIFVFCMLILFVYEWNKKAGYGVIAYSMCASFFFSMYYTYQNEVHNITHLEDAVNYGNYFSDIYIKPWGRCPPYLYGLLLGILYTNFVLEEKKEESEYFLIRLKKSMQRNRRINWMIQFSGFLLTAFITFIPRTAQNDHYWPQLAHSLYLTYGKTLFVVGISLIILPSLLGVDSFVRLLMDTKLFNFVGKVSYCTYLVHFFFILIWFLGQISTFYFEPIHIYSQFAAVSFISIFSGFMLAILVEIPFAKFQKKLIGVLLKSTQHIFKQNETNKSHHKLKIQEKNENLMEKE